MMKGLDIKIENLMSEVKVLRESKSTCCVHCKKIEAVQEKLRDVIKIQSSETTKVSAELDLVDKGMDRLFNRTNDLQKKQAEQVDDFLEIKARLVKLSVQPAQSFLVSKQKPPEFARTSANQRSRPDQVRRPQIRVCYNCRKAGHLAVSCLKPNPRSPLSAGPSPKPTLTGMMKKKLPVANSVEVNTDQSQAEFTPFVYPNGTTNHMLKDYS